MSGSDDPRLTAYALDEVDAETAAAIEQTLRESASARAAVTETVEAAALLSELFAADAKPALDAARRRQIADAAVRPSRAGSLWSPAWAALAAALPVALLLAYRALRPGQQDMRPRAATATIAAPRATASQTPTVAAPAAPAGPRQRRVMAAVRKVSVRGVVRDKTGAVIPGATVRARALDSDAWLSVITRDNGTFALVGIPPGRFEVRAELIGFQTASHILSARAGDVLLWKPTMTVAGVMEAVTVAAATPVFMTSSRASGTAMMPHDGNAKDAQEASAERTDNPFVETRRHPLSTFALDVDTASYSDVRRMLMEDQQLPPADTVRIEELINYFPYEYPAPEGKRRFAAALEVSAAPWNSAHRLLRIGLKTPAIDLGVEQLAGTLVTVAKDVKIQVEFNSAQVRAHRLIGYENRLLLPEDFEDGAKDAGEVGAGHTVTALYELVPARRSWDPPQSAVHFYFTPGGVLSAAYRPEFVTLKLRYKEPQGRKSRLRQWTLVDRDTQLADASADFRFAAAVAEFGMLLRGAHDKGAATFDSVFELAQGALGNDVSGYRSEFLELVRKAQALWLESAEEQKDEAPSKP